MGYGIKVCCSCFGRWSGFRVGVLGGSEMGARTGGTSDIDR